VTSVVVGASSVQQLEDNVAAIGRTEFTDHELAAINGAAVDHPEVDLWREQAQIGVDPGAPHREIRAAVAT
ncbi:MAG: hypothetical protein H0V92_03905, partial [Pseudonocardiales bacterium]|nr:hypothetical protein [Pseudonocardiales bacterium]